MKNQTKRGGTRPNAGRKKSVEKIQINIRISKELYELITKSHIFKHANSSWSQLIEIEFNGYMLSQRYKQMVKNK